MIAKLLFGLVHDGVIVRWFERFEATLIGHLWSYVGGNVKIEQRGNGRRARNQWISKHSRGELHENVSPFHVGVW